MIGAMRTHFAAPLLFASLALGCLVPTVELAGRACDADRPCVDGYSCSAEGTCLAGTPDASTEADAGVADAGSCARAYCDGQAYYTCEQGRPVLATTCAADARCDQARGCLAACGPEGQCPAGKSCDLASSGCVTVPSCSPELPCSSGQCVAGACVPTPGSTAEVSLGGGASEPAALDCYPGSLEPVAGASAAFKGFVLNALGKKTANSIGCTLVVFDAAAFASPSPAPLATTTVVDTPYQGPNGPESAAGFELAEIPTGSTLVAAIAGCDGAMPT